MFSMFVDTAEICLPAFEELDPFNKTFYNLLNEYLFLYYLELKL